MGRKSSKKTFLMDVYTAFSVEDSLKTARPSICSLRQSISSLTPTGHVLCFRFAAASVHTATSLNEVRSRSESKASVTQIKQNES